MGRMKAYLEALYDGYGPEFLIEMETYNRYQEQWPSLLKTEPLPQDLAYRDDAQIGTLEHVVDYG
jgi:hypothetical protein